MNSARRQSLSLQSLRKLRSNLQWLLGEKSSCLLIHLILSSKVWLTNYKEISLQQWNSRALTGGNLRRLRCGIKCYGNRNEHSYLFLTYISPWKKTQTQKTKHSVTGIFCSNLDRNTVGEKPSFSVFVEIFIWCARFSFVGLNRTRNFHFFPTAWARCITILGRAFWR